VDPTGIGALVAFGLVAGIAAFWLAGRLDRDPVLDAVLAWAKRRSLDVRGDGRAFPLTVVGKQGERLFTVSYQSGAELLYLAIDCDAAEGAAADGAAADGARAEGGGAAVTDEGALVSRWTHPTAEQAARLDEALVALGEMAAELERRAPAAEAPHE
jgi:hypothetical protein